MKESVKSAITETFETVTVVVGSGALIGIFAAVIYRVFTALT